MNYVIPAQAGIQKELKLLDSPLSITGPALRRISFVRNDETRTCQTSKMILPLHLDFTLSTLSP